MALVGTLQTLSLPNLIQLQCGQQQPSTVRLVRGRSEGTLAFANGELIFASIGELSGEDAVYELLSWEDGEFHVLEGGDVPARNVETPWGKLVLDSLRRIDEARAEQLTTPEGILTEAQRRDIFKRAVVVSESGDILAAASEGSPDADAALVSFLASRVKTLAAAMSLGPFQRLVSARPSVKLCVDQLPDGYLGCWLDERGSLEPIDQTRQALADLMQK